MPPRRNSNDAQEVESDELENILRSEGAQKRKTLREEDQSMIASVIASCPDAAKKFHLTTPAIMRALGENEGEPRKKRKKTNDDNDDDDENATFRTTVWVRRPDLPPRPGKKPTTAASSSTKFQPDLYLERDPFKFATDGTYDDYVAAIATALSCSVDRLDKTQLKRKFKVPQNSPVTSLSTDVAFEGLLEELQSKTPAKREVYILTAPPKKLEPRSEFWLGDDEESNSEAPKDFDYEALEHQPVGDSLVAQKVKFDAAVRPHRDALEQKYPVGNFQSLFPGERMYRSNDGKFWKLCDLALASWASHLARGTATLTQPPHNSWFDMNRRKFPPKSNSAAPEPITAAAPVSVATPAPAVVGNNQTTDMMQLMLLQTQQMMQMQMSMIQQPARSLFQFPSVSASSAANNSPVHSAPPSPTKAKLPTIHLDAFCTYYSIDDDDKARLEKLGYRPGNRHVGKLEEAHWGENGVKFTPLGWKDFLSIHEQFLGDVKRGLWSDQ